MRVARVEMERRPRCQRCVVSKWHDVLGRRGFRLVLWQQGRQFRIPRMEIELDIALPVVKLVQKSEQVAHQADHAAVVAEGMLDRQDDIVGIRAAHPVDPQDRVCRPERHGLGERRGRDLLEAVPLAARMDEQGNRIGCRLQGKWPLLAHRVLQDGMLAL